MASGTTLRFSVEVAADQAEQALKAMSVAFNQAEVKAKASLMSIGKGSQAAKNDIEVMKQGMGRARETAMFFTQALGEFGPAGRTAQIAVSGVAGAIMGGGGVLLALSLAQAGVRLLVDSWEEDAKKAEEAAKKHKEALEEADKFYKALAAGANTSIGALNSMRDGLRHVSDAQKAHNEVQQINTAIQLAATPAMRAMLEMRLKEAKALEESIRFLKQQEEIEARREKREAKQKEQTKQVQDDLKTRTDYAIEQAQAERAVAEESWKQYQELEAKRGQEAWQRQETEAKNLSIIEAKEKASIEARSQQYAQLGEAAGSMVGGLITGQMTLGQVVAQTGQMIIQSVVKTAIAGVTAKAADAAAGAASSQAAVPLIGPVLAISAMGAMLSAVLGLIGNMPSAAGGWMVPHDTLAMVHEDERILPARYSKGLDRLVANGGRGGTINNYITAMDTQSVGRAMTRSDTEVARAMRRMQRRIG